MYSLVIEKTLRLIDMIIRQRVGSDQQSFIVEGVDEEQKKGYDKNRNPL
jgi:hypothetical protein